MVIPSAETPIPVPVFKPIDFQAFPLISQDTLRQLEESQKRCLLVRQHILRRSAEIVSQLDQRLPDSNTNPHPRFTKQLTLAGSTREPGLESLQCRTRSHSSDPLAQCATPVDQKVQASASASPAQHRPAQNPLKRPWPGQNSSPTKKPHNRPSRISSTDDTQPSTRLPNASLVEGSKSHVLEEAAVPSDQSTSQTTAMTWKFACRQANTRLPQISLPPMTHLNPR